MCLCLVLIPRTPVVQNGLVLHKSVEWRRAANQYIAITSALQLRLGLKFRVTEILLKVVPDLIYLNLFVEVV